MILPAQRGDAWTREACTLLRGSEGAASATRARDGLRVLQEHGDALPARRACGHNGELALLLLQAVGGGGDQAGASGAEGVANGKRAAPRVELAPVDLAHGVGDAGLVDAEALVLAGTGCA